jgi:soluble lytic murein transglycosylase
VSYPLDYVGTLDTESQKGDVDPLFFASLIRQESLWDPSAGSSAGALVLTQVIPPTGEALAAALGVIEFVPAMLFVPSLSLEFGAHYLGGQLAAYGNPWIALSAYNAGPGNAARWASAGVTEPADLVEVIDFSETKNYVTYIFEAYAHYRLAWGD